MSESPKIPASILWLGESYEEIDRHRRLMLLDQFQDRRTDGDPTFRWPLAGLKARHIHIIVLVDNCKDGKPGLDPRRAFAKKAWAFHWRPTGMLFGLTPEDFGRDYGQMLGKAFESELDRIPPGTPEPLVVSDPQKIVDWAREKFPEKQEDQA